MKYSVILILLALIVASCGSDRQEVFEVENEVEFIMPGGLNSIETHVFVLRNVPTFFESSLMANGMTKDQVTSISAAQGLLVGKFNDIDYDFIEEISVRVISPDDRSLNREMFFQDRIPFSHDGELQLFSSISELKDILSLPLIDMEIRVRLRSALGLTLENKLIFSYVVFDDE